MHHNTDAFGDTAPQDIYIPATYWMMGPAWLCTHFWTHYEYTGDREFLKKIFPVMLEAALFYLDFLVEKDGVLVMCPSVSPENTYRLTVDGSHDIARDGTCGVAVTIMVHRSDDGFFHVIYMTDNTIQRYNPRLLGSPSFTQLHDSLDIGNIRMGKINSL